MITGNIPFLPVITDEILAYYNPVEET